MYDSDGAYSIVSTKRQAIDKFLDEVFDGKREPMLSDEMNLQYLASQCDYFINSEKIKDNPNDEIINICIDLLNKVYDKFQEKTQTPQETEQQDTEQVQPVNQ